MNKILKTNKEWQKVLSEELYRIARERGTEPPFSGKYVSVTEAGTYRCACCGEALFSSNAKFDAGCGWPSFDAPMAAEALEARPDHSHGMVRTEILCARCEAHLGHVFPDGPTPTGLRYCINSLSLTLEPKG